MRWALLFVLIGAVGALALLLWPSDARRAGARGVQPTREESIAVAPRPEMRTVAASITGRVTRAGYPAAVDVELWRDHPWRAGCDEWNVERPATRLTVRESNPLAQTRSGADGRFAFSDIQPGAYVVVARAADGARAARTVEIHSRAHVELGLPREGHALSGKLCYRDGRAIRGFVRAVLPEGPLPFETTDEEGAFRLTGLRAGTISVEAIVPGSVRILEPNIGVPHPDALLLAVDARYPDTIRGRVLAYTDDAPVAGARVVVDQGTHIFATTTAKDGGYTAPDLREFAVLSIRAEGFAPFHIWGKLKDGVDHRLLPAAVVTGRVIRDDDGRALPGIRVELRDEVDLHVETSGNDGSFWFHEVALGEIFFYARGEGWIATGTDGASNWPGAETNTRSRFLRADEPIEVEIRMEPAALVEGVVTDEDGVPVEGARVRGARETSTDATGRFVFEAPRASSYFLRVRAPGYFPEQARGIPPIEVRLRPAKAVTVRVESVDGAPIAGARIQSPVQRTDDPLQVWWTDASGRADIVRVHEVLVEADDFVSRTANPTERIVLRPAKAVNVRVLLPDGRPAVGTPLNVRRLSEDEVIASAYTAVDGWARITLPAAGRVHVAAYTDHSLLGGAEARWRAEGEVEVGGTLVLTLESVKEPPAAEVDENAPRFRLRVLDPAGRPVPAGQIHLQFHHVSDGGIYPGADEFDPSRPALFDFQDGVFELVNSEWFSYVDAANEIEIEALGASATRAPGLGYGHRDSTPLPLGAARRGPIPLQGEFEIRLPPERRVEGRVLDADGNPIPGALAWAWPRERVPGQRPIQSRDFGQYDRTRTAHDGSFSLGRIRADPVAVVVDPPRGFLPSGSVEATPGETLTIRLGRGAQPQVTVADPNGRPLAGASVRVRFASWNESFREKRPGFWAQDNAWAWRTDANGVARLGGLEPQRVYRLRVTPPVNRSELAPEEVQRWVPVDTKVDLGAGATIEGVVRDSEGDPRTDAYVYARFANGDGKIVRMEPDGSFKLVNVPAGEVTFTARIDGRDIGTDSRSEPLKVRPGARDVVVLIDRPPSVLLAIADWPKDARSSVTLRDQEDGWDSVSGYVDDDGTLEIVGVDPDKDWEVYIGPTEDGRYAWVKGIRPSLERVRVTLTRGGEIRGVLDLPPGLPTDSVSVSIAHPVIDAYAQVNEDGTFVVRGLPPGTWKITAFAQINGNRFEGEAEAKPGDTIALAVR